MFLRYTTIEGEIVNAEGRRMGPIETIDLTREDGDTGNITADKRKQKVGIKQEVGTSGFVGSAQGRHGRV